MSLSASQRALVEGVLRGETRAAARVMRAIDDRASGYVQLLSALHPHTGRAWVIGVTGTPGAGKSTLVDRLVREKRNAQQKVGVIAVDPTSPYTGGAILGDRIRMQSHFLDEGVFIRSLASRGHLGGLSRSAGDVLRVMDALGCDVVFVETVGVGQGELEVARLAHTTVVVLAPGGGDDVQAIKAGVLEVADVFAINKADRPGADGVVRDIEGMLALGDSRVRVSPTRGHAGADLPLRSEPEAGRPGSWTPPVLRTAAADGQGIEALLEACSAHQRFLQTTEEGQRRNAERRQDELAYVFRDRLLADAERRLAESLSEAAQAVGVRREDPYRTADALMAKLYESVRRGGGES